MPAAVMCWLATAAEVAAFQRRTIHAQPFALKQGIVAGWRNAEPASAQA